MGRFVARRAVLVLLLWVALAAVGYAAAVGGVFGESLFSRLTSGDLEFPGESTDGRELLAANAQTGPTYQLLLEDVDPGAPEVASALAEANADLTAIDGVLAVTDPTLAGAAFVSVAGDALLVSVSLEKGLTDEREEATIDAIVERLDAVEQDVPGSLGTITGYTLIVDDITDQVETDLRTGEVIALPLSLLIMIVIFGGFAAASVPIAGAIASIAGGLGALLAFSYYVDLDASVVNVVTVLGLGLCIDYALLVVSRYREEVGTDHGKDDIPDRDARAEAMATTMATAGRTVAFSAVTVAIAVSGLLWFDVDIIRAVGLGALCVVLVAMLVALTAVPALLSLMTRWVSRPGLLARLPLIGGLARTFGDAPPAEGVFSRLAGFVQRHPWLVAGGVVAALVTLALPALRMSFVSSGIELLPVDAEQRVVVEEIEGSFPVAATPEIRVVTAAPTPAEADQLGLEVAQIDNVERVDPARAQGDIVVLDVFLSVDGQSEEAKQVVADIREEEPDFEIWVTGRAAALVDFVDRIAADAPAALGWLAAATFILLFLLTGSVLIPIKALAMIVLSLGATFGVLVWVFQDGRFTDPLDYTPVGGIEAVIPIMVFAFAFGLSMDYEVFLLSRIKEFHDQGLDNDDAVRSGLQRTGRVITSAALIIVVVFSGFVVGDLLVIKQVGVALAVAVVIDATLVRILLVPATMTLLGEWNWWAPGPLRWLHERVGLSESGASAVDDQSEPEEPIDLERVLEVYGSPSTYQGRRVKDERKPDQPGVEPEKPTI